MIEIRFQGRGGQGVVVASELLARACFEEGLYPQCYSIFGGERRGAPVAAFVRVGGGKIFLKCDIERPDHLVLFDPTLFTSEEISWHVAKGGSVLISTVDDGKTYPTLEGIKVGRINGLDISKSNGLGSFVNTAVLGAYVGLTGIVKIESLLKVIEDNVPAARDKNRTAAREAYSKVAIQQESGPL